MLFSEVTKWTVELTVKPNQKVPPQENISGQYGLFGSPDEAIQTLQALGWRESTEAIGFWCLGDSKFHAQVLPVFINSAGKIPHV